MPTGSVPTTVYRALLCWVVAVLVGGIVVAGATPGEFQFAVLGDRTGSMVPGVYRQVLAEAAEDHPAFLLTVGDAIEGGNSATMNSEWRDYIRLFASIRDCPLYSTPGNHDVWSTASAMAYERYTKHPLHYSFDYGPTHFVILDNSRSDEMPASELTFLEQDLTAHRAQPLKFIVSHRPSWLLQVVLGSGSFPLQQIAKRFGVQYIIAGHTHQMLHAELDGITYLTLASSGGHLRSSKKYEDGWFFAHSLVTIENGAVRWQIKETKPPFGKARVSHPADWGIAGLAAHRPD